MLSAIAHANFRYLMTTGTVSHLNFSSPVLPFRGFQLSIILVNKSPNSFVSGLGGGVPYLSSNTTSDKQQLHFSTFLKMFFHRTLNEIKKLYLQSCDFENTYFKVTNYLNWDNINSINTSYLKVLELNLFKTALHVFLFCFLSGNHGVSFQL